MKTKYPIYIPSKGRFDCCYTAELLKKDKVPFMLVVERQEKDEYVKRFGADSVLVLPFRDKGSVVPARNWCKDHATKGGHKRHWQLDDNITDFGRVYKHKRIPCHSGVAMDVVEEFTDRYTNIAIAGMNYNFFVRSEMHPPFVLNCHVYSCSLILNEIPNKWRGNYNEDTDLCLQVLGDGWCTVLFNAFVCFKMLTMQIKGGNTSELYHGDGRLKMARSLERQWHHVVSTDRRFNRPQHIVAKAWRKFDTPLIRRTDIDFDKLKNKKHKMKLLQTSKNIKSKKIRLMQENYDAE